MRAGQWCRDVRTMLGLFFRLLLSRKWIGVFLISIGVLYVLLLSGLAGAAEEKARIGLAVCMEEEGTEAGDLLEFLQSQPIFDIQEMNEKEALAALKEGEVMAVLIVEKGYERWLETGRGKPLQLMYPEGQETMRILSDLVAGGVLERYCLYQSYAAYGRQKGLEPISWEEYQQTAEDYRESEESGEIMVIRYETVESEGTTVDAKSGKRWENAALYQQVVLGMLAGILMLLALLLYAGGREDALDIRGYGSVSRSAVWMAYLLYGVISVCLLGTVLLLVFLWESLETGGAVKTMYEISLPAIGYLCVFSVIVSGVFLIVRQICGQDHYLPTGMVVYALLTLASLVRVAAAFLPERLEMVVRCLPGGWLVDRIILLLYG